MDLWLVWIVAGFALAIAELLSGTFYLLVIGVGAFTGALVAWMGGNMLVQAALGGAVAIGGAFAVHHWHARQKSGDAQSNFLDRGQPVVLEGWANESANLARVKYRGSSWDARLAQGGHPSPGTTLYIEGQEGSTLVVAASAPAPR
jgi:membrane protein implicated in regulation of membrane protease activity